MGRFTRFQGVAAVGCLQRQPVRLLDGRERSPVRAATLRGGYHEWPMTAKEQLLQQAPGWSEHDAEVALRAVQRAHAEPAVDGWGDLDEFSARASSATLRRLDEEEATAGFSWEQHCSS